MFSGGGGGGGRYPPGNEKTYPTKQRESGATSSTQKCRLGGDMLVLGIKMLFGCVFCYFISWTFSCFFLSLDFLRKLLDFYCLKP